MKNKIILAIILLTGILLISSCKPAGRAIEMPEQNYDLANFPETQFSYYDLEPTPVLVNIYTTPAFEGIAEELVSAIETKMCEGQQINGEVCAFEANFIDSVQDIPRYIAIGRQGLACDLLDETLCDELVEGKALIQYIDQGQLVITGGTDADVTEAVYTLTDFMEEKVYLNGYYSDIINTDMLRAASHITDMDEIKYTTTFYFKQGENTIASPLEMPYDRETITAFFGANLDKINKIYLYDLTEQKYVGVYHSDTEIPSNIDKFAERGMVYSVDATEDFELTIFGAELPQVNLAGYYNAPVYSQRVLNSFVTGAAVK